MVTPMDVDANKLIEKIAQKLEDIKIEKPAYVGFVKSGAHVERPPEQKNFWYVRCASVLRQAYIRPRIGVQSLRKHYGGRKNNGVRPEHKKPAGGSLVRDALQKLEQAGFLEKTESVKIRNKQGKEIMLYRGRRLTSKGRKFLDSVAKEVADSQL